VKEHNEEESKLNASVTRRNFLAFTGLAAAGLAAGQVLKPLGNSVAATAAVSAGTAAATTGKNIEAARTLIQAFNTGDVRLVDNLVHSSLASYAVVVKQNIADIRRAFPNARFTEDEIVAEGDKVILRWTMIGNNNGSWLGAQPTNRQIRTIGYDVLRFQGGKAVEYINGIESIKLETLSKLGLLNQEMVAKLVNAA